MNRAAIDLGSNSVLLTVLDENGHILHDELSIVGLGRHLGDGGEMESARMAHGEAVLSAYVATAATYHVAPEAIRVAATSGARRATNAPAWFAHLEEKLGVKLPIISGEREAELAWKGAFFGLPGTNGIDTVIDLGGGSTEIVCGSKRQSTYRTSLETGAVRLTEMFFPNECVTTEQINRAREHIRQLLDDAETPSHTDRIVGVAGTITTLAAIIQNLMTYDRQKIHGYALSRPDLESLFEQLHDASAEQRRAIAHIAPQRAEFLLGGSLIVLTLMAHFACDELMISDGGIRFGLLLE